MKLADDENLPEQLPEIMNTSQDKKHEGGLRINGFYKCSLSDKPLITIITVVFNGAATIRDTIESVLQQTYDNIEYIIVDGNSMDGTIEIVKQYEYAIDYWISEKDDCIYDAMNKGLTLSKGMYIGMLNADDLFADKEVVRNLVESLQRSKADAIFSYLDIVDKRNLKRVLRKYRVEKLSSGFLRIGVMPPHPTFYCKRTCLESAGQYKTDYRIAADFEMMVRLCIKQKISWEFFDKVTVLMRSGGVSNNGFLGRIRLNMEIIKACRANGLYTNIFLLALKLPLRLLERLR